MERLQCFFSFSFERDAQLHFFFRRLFVHSAVVPLSRIGAPFWDAMRDFVAPVGRLRKLKVEQVAVVVPEDDNVAGGDFDAAFLGRLTRLEELALRYGVLRAFPTSLLALTNLRDLDLKDSSGITSLPGGISSPRGLESLDSTEF